MSTLTTICRLMSRTLGPPLRALGPGDPAFLDPHGRSHADAMGVFTHEHWERLIRSYGLVGSQAVLDVACGSGDWLTALASMNDRVVGVDVDDEMIALAGARSSAAGNVEVRKMPAERLEYGEGSFDLVTCLSALPYLDQHAAIGEIARVLRPGGRLLIGTVGPGYYAKHIVEGIRHDDVSVIRYGVDPLLVTAARALGSDRIAPGSLKGWSPRAVRRLLSRHGFAVDRVMRDVRAVGPGWPTTVLASPVYFVVFATRRTG